MDKYYKIKTGCNAVHILRELKKHNIGYCITEYDECIVYFTVTNILKREISILENIEWIEEINE